MCRILITHTLIAVGAIAAYNQRDRLTPDAPEVLMPIVSLLADAGPQAIVLPHRRGGHIISTLGRIK